MKLKARDIVPGWPRGRSTSMFFFERGEYHERQQAVVDAYFEDWRRGWPLRFELERLCWPWNLRYELERLYFPWLRRDSEASNCWPRYWFDRPDA